MLARLRLLSMIVLLLQLPDIYQLASAATRRQVGSFLCRGRLIRHHWLLVTHLLRTLLVILTLLNNQNELLFLIGRWLLLRRRLLLQLFLLWTLKYFDSFPSVLLRFRLLLPLKHLRLLLRAVLEAKFAVIYLVDPRLQLLLRKAIWEKLRYLLLPKPLICCQLRAYIAHGDLRFNLVVAVLVGAPRVQWPVWTSHVAKHIAVVNVYPLLVSFLDLLWTLKIYLLYLVMQRSFLVPIVDFIRLFVWGPRCVRTLLAMLKRQIVVFLVRCLCFLYFRRVIRPLLMETILAFTFALLILID